MNSRRRTLFASALLIGGLVTAPLRAETRDLVILYTNDYHSAIDPIPAYWLGSPERRLGGAAELMTLVERIRAEEATKGNPVFLFDAGDMFTGMLAKLTQGEVMMEMMRTLGYDAFGVGNHEFDYGWESFRHQMYRVPYPSLGANIFYEGTRVPFSQPHVILERGGVRLGVIGVIGQDARSVVLPSNVTELEFTDPGPAIARSIEALEDDVDLIVVLAHQGHTGPQQTDAEHHPEVQRDFSKDIDLVGAVEGVDVLVSGHAHRGIELPYAHPETGALIVQTYGYGTRLGVLRLTIDTDTGRVIAHRGELMPVWSDDLEPHPEMVERMDVYRRRVAPMTGEVVGQTPVRLTRRYNQESLLGAFATDVLREVTGAEVAFINAGGLRADLPRGAMTLGDVQDAFPFQDTPVLLDMTGADVRAVLEQGLTLERGLVQTSGLTATYDLSRPAGARLVEVSIDGEPLDDDRRYEVATNSFLAQGGDLYEPFTHGDLVRQLDHDTAWWIADTLRRLDGPLAVPELGRMRRADGSPRAGAIDADMAIERMIDFLGGQEAIDALGELSVEAECRGPEGAFRTWVDSSRPGRVRFRQKAAEFDSEYVSTPERTWIVDEEGVTRDLPAGTRAFLRGHEFHLMLLDIRERFPEFRVADEDRPGCRMLAMTSEWNRPASLCLEPTTFRPIWLEVNPEGAAGTVRITFEAWHSVGGLQLFRAFDLQEGSDRHFRYDYVRIEYTPR